ncbi:MAG: hypothetical protein COC04_02250 [Gammaproteobacteria bacterium]|nr:MAG: hypothetical protein COC04_02250 [Gammaproteobacteria bacterium]
MLLFQYIYLANRHIAGSKMAEPTLTQQVNAVLATLTSDIKNHKLEIPSPPDLLIKLREVAANENSTIDDIVAVVKHDPHISGRLIKVANCALFGARQHVTSVKAAVSRLGLSKVQNLIIGLTIAQSMMQAKTLGLKEYFETIWQQSNRVAAISSVLALRKTKIDPEKALLAGMVHNIGTLPLVLRLHRIPELQKNQKVLQMVADVVIPKLYASAGELVMKSWNFPAEITSIALSHRESQREASDEINLDDIVLIAHQLSKLTDYTKFNGDDSSLLSAPVFKLFWNDQEHAEEELISFHEEIDQMMQVMSN